jgi:murein DD-endopeptidase MepM/ murein hydrolase activator NlpD
MKRPSDLLLLVILLAAALVGTLAPVGGAAFHFSPSVAPGFSESFLLTAGPEGASPSPEIFRSLGKMGRVVVASYEVNPHDTLASVSKTFGSAPDFVRSTNRLDSVSLVPGKTLVVHNGLGMIYRVREKKGRVESVREIARKYNLSPLALSRANHLPGVAILADQWLDPGQEVLLPGVRLRFADYLMPVAWTSGHRMISSGFGYRRHPVLGVRRLHQGLDLPRPAGSPVRAACEGRVIFAGWQGGFGRLIILKHPGGMKTWYGHLSKILVEPGQKVGKGTYIGRVGSSGLATGPHLHFEVRDRFGKAINPKKFLF